MGKRGTAGRDKFSGALVTAALSQPHTRRLDSIQQARLHRAAGDAALLYPDDPDLQRHVLAAAIDYRDHRADLDADAAQWQPIREQEKRIRARVPQLAVMSVADRVASEPQVARVIGVDCMLLRRWSGKRANTGAAGASSLSRGALR